MGFAAEAQADKYINVARAANLVFAPKIVGDREVRPCKSMPFECELVSDPRGSAFEVNPQIGRGNYAGITNHCPINSRKYCGSFCLMTRWGDAPKTRDREGMFWSFT